MQYWWCFHSEQEYLIFNTKNGFHFISQSMQYFDDLEVILLFVILNFPHFIRIQSHNHSKDESLNLINPYFHCAVFENQ